MTAKQRKMLIRLAEHAGQVDLLAALTTDDQTAGYFTLITKKTTKKTTAKDPEDHAGYLADMKASR